MYLLERCRTGELGSVLYSCQQCDHSHRVAQSCGNRHCPQCQGHKAQEWYQKQLARLLPCAYFLITFTVPEELRRSYGQTNARPIARCSRPRRRR